MIKNYLKIAWRSLNKNKLFSSINIIGLAVAMSVGILMILFLSEIYSFDDFHTQKDNIYRVNTSREQYGEESQYATSSIYIGNEIKNEVAGIEKMVFMRGNMSANVKTEKGAVSFKGFYASATFFDVFSFGLIKGNPQTALSNPNGIILTESTSVKLFGAEDPMGKSVTLENNSDFENGIITGIVEDPPLNSHIQFDALVSLKTLETSIDDQATNFLNDPEDIYSYTYLVLNQHTKKEEVESAISTIMTNYNSNIESPITHFLQPMNDFVPGDSYYNEPGPSFSTGKIYIMLSLLFIVLLSACFNYTNLSLARALRRSKEIGVRKVLGADRIQVFSQFMVEAIVLSLLALVIGIGLFFLIKPEFLNLPNPSAKGFKMFALDINSVYFLYFLAFAITIGFIAGFLPALSLSKLKVLNALNDVGKKKVFSGINLRRILVTLQFGISISLIMGAVLISQQYKFALNYDLGFATENIVNINVRGNDVDLLENEYANIPEVINTSKSSITIGTGGAAMGFAKSEDESYSSSFMSNTIDEKYLAMHEFKIIAGSNFLKPLKEDVTSEHIIVNKAFLEKLNLGTPEEAIGENIWYNNNKLMIHGVVDDFVNLSLTMEIEKSFAFLQSNTNQFETLGLKIKSDDFLATMERVENIYKKIDPSYVFEASFYDDQIAQTYQQHKTTYSIISFLALLAISISTLGLLGMAVFTIENRMKEISIRKVLGANLKNLVFLLSKNFLAMIMIAGIITIPITYYLVDTMLINEFLYRIGIGYIEIFSGLLIVTAIGVLTIGWQIRMAATKNPTKFLRDQ